MAPVLKELLNQTAVSVMQLEMQLMPFTGPHLENANVSSSVAVYTLYIVIFYKLIYNVAYCDNNCAGSVGFGCATCKVGFMSPPECCQCVPGRDEDAGVCSKLAM